MCIFSPFHANKTFEMLHTGPLTSLITLASLSMKEADWIENSLFEVGKMDEGDFRVEIWALPCKVKEEDQEA